MELRQNVWLIAFTSHVSSYPFRKPTEKVTYKQHVKKSFISVLRLLLLLLIPTFEEKLNM